ncbi:MAG: hypothetical protein FGM37_05140 [Phycisphaerales bacterium]|nr:hypothetical protein [Phycisphaerales bacterium]
MSRRRGTGDAAGAAAHATGAGAQPRIHNMSCRPTVTLTHKSDPQCRRLRFSTATWPASATAFADYCPALGLPMPTAAEGYARLLEAASEPCPLLARLPPVAAVMRNAAGESIAGLTDNPRVVLAVMSRCFGHVFMRDLPPSITSDSLRLQVTLLIPKSWNLNP